MKSLWGEHPGHWYQESRLNVYSTLALPHPGFVLRQNLPSPWQEEGIKESGNSMCGKILSVK
jgi:hypothetical protein